MMADGSQRIIRSIQSGDEILDPLDGTPVRVAAVIEGPEYLPMWDVSAGGKTVRVTHDHPFLTRKGFKQARNLRLKDVEIVWEGEPSEKWRSGLALDEIQGLVLDGIATVQAPGAEKAPAVLFRQV